MKTGSGGEVPFAGFAFCILHFALGGELAIANRRVLGQALDPSGRSSQVKMQNAKCKADK
jgi:hypothetical protein